MSHKNLYNLLQDFAFLTAGRKGSAQIVGLMIRHNFFEKFINVSLITVGFPLGHFFFDQLNIRGKHGSDGDPFINDFLLIFLLAVLCDYEFTLEVGGPILTGAKSGVQRQDDDRFELLPFDRFEKLLLLFLGERIAVLSLMLDRLE